MQMIETTFFHNSSGGLSLRKLVGGKNWKKSVLFQNELKLLHVLSQINIKFKFVKNVFVMCMNY